MVPFVIHLQLLADSHRLGRFDLCHVLLHKNGLLPWFILVPETEATDLLDMAERERNTAMKEAASVSDFVKTQLGYGKINFAAIGNVVSQLHLHIVGRRAGDLCWPAAVWGNLTQTRPYTDGELGELTAGLQRHCRLQIRSGQA